MVAHWHQFGDTCFKLFLKLSQRKSQENFNQRIGKGQEVIDN
jgi:hypothetical protein